MSPSLPGPHDFDSEHLLSFNVSDYGKLRDMLESQQLSVPITCAVIILLGVVGNVLVVVSALRTADMRTSTNLLIANIGVADCLFCIFCCLPDAVRYHLWHWPFGWGMCKVMYFFASVTLYMRIYTLLLLSLERMLTLMHPDVNRRAMYLIIVGVLWMVLCLNSLFGPIVSVVVEVFYPWEGVAYDWCVLMGDTFNEFWWGMFIFSFMLPLVAVYLIFAVMAYRYCFGYSLSRSMRDIPDAKSTTVVVFLVAVMCTACWLPLYWIMLSQTGGPTHMPHHLDVAVDTGGSVAVAYVLGYTDMCINPLIYFLLMPAFRGEFARALTVRCKKTVLMKKQKEDDQMETSSLNRATIEL
ncbi:PREDICTED: allatostatin-A receptor-like [Priapulus caudatus]|uniref:Allatostatin-A receptor-like n=1 Tax=Priapulus caudatus TaxID=37621 RepID=A0ABM1F9T5_PRICU|nr:PREDICTED: allatostatin-A receptor-like [Priapulus caudatus]